MSMRGLFGGGLLWLHPPIPPHRTRIAPVHRIALEASKFGVGDLALAVPVLSETGSGEQVGVGAGLCGGLHVGIVRASATSWFWQ